MEYHGKIWSDDHELPWNFRGYHGEKKYGQMTMNRHGVSWAIMEKYGQMTMNCHGVSWAIMEKYGQMTMNCHGISWAIMQKIWSDDDEMPWNTISYFGKKMMVK